MPLEETIGTGLKIILELIKILNPSELKELKKEIQKVEEKNEEETKKLKKAMRDGDIDYINAHLFGK